jgi:hypothetical protein
MLGRLAQLPIRGIKMIKFDSNATFNENLEIALKELQDDDIATIIRNRINDFLVLASADSSRAKTNIVSDLEELIEKRLKDFGETK